MSAVFDELQRRVRRSASFAPCLPRPAKVALTGPGWIHEIKHDGFRIIAQKKGERVRLITRNGTRFRFRLRLALLSTPSKTKQASMVRSAN
jgi:ATP-dependent DNA ligase